MAAHFPDQVDMELTRTLKPTQLTFRDVGKWVAKAKEVTPLGYFGDPASAKIEESKQYHEAFCKMIADAIEKDMKINKAFFAQDKTDTQELYVEIAGDYEFEFEGQVDAITFYVEDGILMGRDSDDDRGTPLEPAEDQEMGFEVTTEEGQFIEITFSRDENGKITNCILKTMGMEIKGVKIDK
jgi:hypothetical protein